MDNSLTTSFFVTLVGMGAVFSAMALIYASMQILTALVRDKPVVKATADNEPKHHPLPGQPVRSGTRILGLRAAGIAVALARTEEIEREGLKLPPRTDESTSWGEYYRHRQLRPSGRGRGA